MTSTADHLLALFRGIYRGRNEFHTQQTAPALVDTTTPTETVAALNDIDPMEKTAAEALWAEQDDLVFDFDWHDGKPNMGRNSFHEPSVTAIFPDGKKIVFAKSHRVTSGMRVCSEEAELWTPRVTLKTHDEQHMDIGYSSIIRNAWHAVVAVRIARSMGMHHAVATIDPADADALPNLIEEILHDNTPTPIEASYTYQGHVTSWSGDTRPPDPEPYECPTPWRGLKDDLRIRITQNYYDLNIGKNADSWNGHMTTTMSTFIAYLSGDDFGFVSFSGERAHAVLEEKRKDSVRQAFGGKASKRIPVVMGNAKASRIISLTNEIVRRHPDIADAAGTPIAPLVQKHIPRLLNAHAEALKTASTRDIEAIDRELNEGLEVVRKAVEEAMAIQSQRDRGQLATELHFLRLRHPDASSLEPEKN